MRSKLVVRVFLVVVVLSAAAWVGVAYVNKKPDSVRERQYVGVTQPPPASAPPASGITVVTTQGLRGEQNTSHLIAYARSGEILYEENVYPSYFDVDPVSSRNRTVEVVTARDRSGETCPDWIGAENCAESMYVRINVTTGERNVLWRTWSPPSSGTRIHDIDRVNETHIAVADIWNESVLLVDLRTDTVEFRWNVSDAYDLLSSGSNNPRDWAHLNDVEVLDDGRLMLSPRNHDRVIFVDPGKGVNESWTLGAEDDYSILNEQHNPDFIPEREGGPAVLVADSHNDRIVEYQRVDGNWTKTWVWQDNRLAWPRDADRLPNGHTLVTDSNGDRVLEVDTEGRIVWSVEVDRPYEAERLTTGDESVDGPAARDAGLVSRKYTQFSVLNTIQNLLPEKVVSAAFFLLPPWMRFGELLAATVAATVWVGWLGVETWWAYCRWRGDPQAESL